MARCKVLIVAAVALTAFALVIAAAPAQGTPGAARQPAVAASESNEQIVADFLWRKERAERAQRAILLNLRKDLDRKRAEFDEAHKRYDQARGRYVEIVGPLAKQGFMNPDDPRLPYEFAVRRSGPEVVVNRTSDLSQRGGEAGSSPSGVDVSPRETK